MKKTLSNLIICLLLVAMTAFAQGPSVTISGGNAAQGFTARNTFSGTNMTYRCKAKTDSVAEETFVVNVYAIGDTLTSIVVLADVGTVTTTVVNAILAGDLITISGEAVDGDLNGVYSVVSITSTKIFTIATVDVANATYNQALTQFKTEGESLTSIADAAAVSTVTTVNAHGLTIGNQITIGGSSGDTDLNGTYLIATVPTTKTFTIATASVSDATYTTTHMYFTSTDPRTSLSIWSVKKFAYDGSNNPISEMWADGNPAFDNVCDDQATLHYK